MDFEAMVGKRLTQVCIGAYEIIFHFDDKISLTIESDFEIGDGSSVTRYDEIVPSSLSAAGLVGESITSAQLRDDRSLEISFTASKTLIAVKTSENFDCYRIQTPDSLFVV